MSANDLPKVAIAEILAQKICAFDAAGLPQAVRAKCEALLIDPTTAPLPTRNSPPH